MKPLLLLDIDGVLLPFGLDLPPDCFCVEGLVGAEHCSPAALQVFALADQFELMWCSAWEQRAESELAQRLRRDGHAVPLLAALPMPPANYQPNTTWKLPAVRDFVGERALAWVDDDLYDDAQQWAARRQAPTLLLPTQSHQGLSRAHIQRLRQWAHRLETPRKSSAPSSVNAPTRARKPAF